MRTKKFIQIAAVGLLVLAGCAKKEIGIDHAESAQTGLTDSQTILTGIQDVEIYYMEPAMTIEYAYDRSQWNRCFRGEIVHD